MINYLYNFLNRDYKEKNSWKVTKKELKTNLFSVLQGKWMKLRKLWVLFIWGPPIWTFKLQLHREKHIFTYWCIHHTQIYLSIYLSIYLYIYVYICIYRNKVKVHTYTSTNMRNMKNYKILVKKYLKYKKQ